MNADIITSVFRKMQTSLKSVALRITGDSDDADDTLQDVFLKLWGSSAQMHEIANLEAYISSAVRNRSLDVVRQRRNPVSISETDIPEIPDFDHDFGIEEMYRSVMSIIESQLPPLQRRILTLRDVKMLEFEEISNILGIPESTVRVYLSRARATVRKLYRQM